MNMDVFKKDQSHLDALLLVGDVEDLDILVDYITDKGEGRIALDTASCRRLLISKELGEYSDSDRYLIGHEIKLFAGNTLSNAYRDMRGSVDFGSVLDKLLPDATHTVAYNEVVRDVATKLKVSCNKTTPIPVMEDGILRKILSDSFEKMTPEERAAVLQELNVTSLYGLKPAAAAAAIGAGKAGGFATYKIAVIVAHAVAKFLTGKGLSFAAGAMITRSVSIALGPVGWIFTGLWTVADMVSPAYRVTVPCVVQIAYMRQKALAKIYSTTCKSCNAMNSIEAKFCVECGAKMETAA